MVKLFVTETAQKAALEGMQMMGGYGYSSEYDMERLVRATLVSTIYGGTSEIQRNIIAKTLGLSRPRTCLTPRVARWLPKQPVPPISTSRTGPEWSRRAAARLRGAILRPPALPRRRRGAGSFF